METQICLSDLGKILSRYMHFQFVYVYLHYVRVMYKLDCAIVGLGLFVPSLMKGQMDEIKILVH